MSNEAASTSSADSHESSSAVNFSSFPIMSKLLKRKLGNLFNTESEQKRARVDGGGNEKVDLSVSEVTYTLENGGFEMISTVPASHYFILSAIKANNKQALKVVKKEITILKTCLPPGIWVKCFEDRMDLFSTMIRGPTGTPYEDCLFVFDIILPNDYPNSPPGVFYYAFGKYLNPNLYANGLVCLSLLGTWKGNKSESWTNTSTLLQVLISIQALILNKEPYNNEPYRKKNNVRSREYNAQAVHNSLLTLGDLLIYPHPAFETEIKDYVAKNFAMISERRLNWLEASESFNKEFKQLRTGGRRLKAWISENVDKSSVMEPDFPLLPIADKYCQYIRNDLEVITRALTEEY